MSDPALILPDEQSWALWGPDPGELGLRADFGPVARLGRALVPRELPGGLQDEGAALLAGLATGARVARLPGPPADVVVRPTGSEHHAGEEHGEGEEHHADGDDGGEEHDMMAIVGEPSADGLVMEELELTHGPFGTARPGGLELTVSLDGDVVSSCRVTARLQGGGALADPGADPAPPDLLALAAWRAAIDRACGRPADLRAVERERALSHVAWLRAFARVLGDERLAGAAGAAVGTLRAGAPEAEERVAALEPILLRGALRRRLDGRGVLDAEAARTHGLHGPIARAAGLALDARTDDPAYRAAGFVARTEEGGDALARARLRLAEALDALALEARLTAATEGTAVIEAPRGPLLARRLPAGWLLAARGAAEARRTGGDLVVGLEWGAALVVLGSLDLSPWAVGP